MGKKYHQSNPVIETYRGFEIRKYPMLRIRVDVTTYKEIIDARIDTGLSDRQILGYSSKPCESCKTSKVFAFNSEDEKVEVKRGILSKFIPKK